MNYQIIRDDDIVAAYVLLGQEHCYSHEHEQAYELLRNVVWDFYKENTEKLHIEKGIHGKPFFVDSGVQFNISHCKGMAACAVSKIFCLGIDVENVRPYRENVAKRVMTGLELQKLEQAEDKDEFFFRVWTAKESLVKMSGDGIIRELNQMDSLENRLIVGRHEVVHDKEHFLISIAAEKKINIPVDIY